MKTEDKIRKLLALADRGFGGEKDNAKRMLEKLLKKHGISLSNIEGESTAIEWFRYKGKIEKKLLFQIIAAVVNNKDLGAWSNVKKRQSIGVEVTKSQMIEIELMFNSYSNAINEEIDILFSAFVNKNDIFPSNSSINENQEQSEEEIQKMYRVGLMQETLRRVNIRKQIS